MGLYVSTTGVDVEIEEFGFTLAHPETDYAISDQFDADEVRYAETLTTTIRNGTLIWRMTPAGAIQPPTDYDPDYLDAERENTGDGLEDNQVVLFKDLNSLVAVSASPGYSFGGTGNINNSFLLRPGGAPSNKTGINLGLANAVLRKITSGSEVAATFDIEIYQHDGGGENITLITTVSVVASKKNEFDITDIYPLTNPILSNRHVAVKVVGSVKNPGVDLQFSGSTS